MTSHTPPPLPSLPTLTLPGQWDTALTPEQTKALLSQRDSETFTTAWLPDNRRCGFVGLVRRGLALTGAAYYFTPDVSALLREQASEVCGDPVMALRLHPETWVSDLFESLSPPHQQALAEAYVECRGVPLKPKYDQQEFLLLCEEHLRVASTRAYHRLQAGRSLLSAELQQRKERQRQVVLN